MSNNLTDILLIKQYLNGELDARAMHELERRAQQDPFLADALEGYASAGILPEKHNPHLQQLLQNRVYGKERKFSLWPGISIAASVLLAGAVGFWIYFSHQPGLQRTTAVESLVVTVAPDAPSVILPSNPVTQKPLAALKERSVIKGEKQYHAGVKSFAGTHKHTVGDIDEPVGNAPVSAQVAVADTLTKAPEGYFAPQRTLILSGKKKVPTMKPDSQYHMAGQQIVGKAEGVRVDVEPGDRHLVTGRLIDGTDGQPLMNAMVRIKGDANGAITDKAGNFRIAAGEKDVIQISSMGYLSREIKAAQQGDSLNIKLQPSHAALAEVVIAPSRKPDKNAEPLMGWKMYQRILNNLSSPDEEKGTVKLEFTVNADGSLGNFRVISGLSDAANQIAINRIANGPPWHGNRNGQPEHVRVKIKFVK